MADLTNSDRNPVKASLSQGSDGWRRAYTAFGLMVLGIVAGVSFAIARMNYASTAATAVLLVAGFGLSRAAIARAGQTKNLGRQKWLLYPPLLVIYGPLLMLLLFWPVAPAKAIVDGHLFAGPYTERLGVCRYCGPGARAVDLVFISAAMLGLWWAVLGILCGVWSAPARILLRPFADTFSRNGAVVMTIVGLLVALLFAGAILLSV